MKAATADAQTGAAAPDVDAGKRVALKICSTCHVVARDQPGPPLLSHPAPSFAAIANRRSTNEDSLRLFITKTHATIQGPPAMPNPQLTDDQTRDVAAYLMSLRTRR